MQSVLQALLRKQARALQEKMSISHPHPNPDTITDTVSEPQHFAFDHGAHFPFVQNTMKKMEPTY